MLIPTKERLKKKKLRSVSKQTRDSYYSAFLATRRTDLLTHPDREQAFWDAKTEDE